MPTKNLHIGFVITSLVGGGAEKVVLTLAEEMVKQGCSVDIFVMLDKTDYIEPSGVDIHKLSKYKKISGFFEDWRYRKLSKVLSNKYHSSEMDKGKFDKIFFNLPEDYILGDICGFDNAYYCLHVSITGMLKSYCRRSQYRSNRLKKKFSVLNDKHIITVSHDVGSEINSIEWLNPKSVKTIYNPFDIEYIRRMSDDDIGEDNNIEYIIHIGRASSQKRHDLLFEAFSNIPKQYKLVLLSKDSAKLHKLANKYDIDDRVIIPGFQSNPYKWIKKSKLLVLSSDFEGFGNVLVEAFICGTPVVSTDCPYGPREILSGSLSEWLVPVGDATALSKKIRLALESSIDIDEPDILNKVAVGNVVNQYLTC